MRPIINHDVPLAPLTSLGVGGSARFFCEVVDEDGVAHAIAWAEERSTPWTVLGGGTNVVVSDDGYDGLVIQLDMRGIKSTMAAGSARVTALAGEPWDGFVAHCVSRGWAGIECLSGIPGRVGATPIQNVGAYGQEVSQTIEVVRAFDTEKADMVELESAACGFAYRDSLFKSHAPGRYVVTAVTYRLVVDGEPTVRHGEVSERLAERGLGAPTLVQVRHAVVEVRRRKSMVLDSYDPDSRSVGSFFVNPTVDAQAWERIVEAARSHDLIETDDVPPHHVIDEKYKLSAAWLIENAGFYRGYERGEAGLSSSHCLAIVNRGQATARDVMALAREIESAVLERFGVGLIPEPRFIGPMPSL
ncbi:MAG: UDP-N-acetylmuramate dehydrogenase [Proteobacteria bacterium]|nr:UDP-N-acetylmuramate dehydrogenase [Pseudomonadota bacterium]